MSFMMQPQIILLKEGTDTSQGKAQLLSNISACCVVADTVRTTLGPRGMDKLIYDGRKATISNDGATIMRLLDIVHPAAKVLVEISMSQDAEVGDGTTSVVLLAAEVLKEFKPYLEDGLHPRIIIRELHYACKLAIACLTRMAIPTSDPAAFQQMLIKCAGTALNSKLIAHYRPLFCPMIVKAINTIIPSSSSSMSTSIDATLIGIKQIPGGSVTDSFLVCGVAFKKTFSYAGFESQPKHFDRPKVLLLHIELELKSEKDNAEVRISNPADYQSIIDAEWSIIYNKLNACKDCGANIVLSRLPIGDLATQFFAKNGMFCAGRVERGDMERVSRATGAQIQTSLSHVVADSLSSSSSGAVVEWPGSFDEVMIGDETYNILAASSSSSSSSAGGSSCTIILRGGGDVFLNEVERSVHDAVMIVKKCVSSSDGGDCGIVAGGGACEMKLSHYLSLQSLLNGTSGKRAIVLNCLSRALQVIPRAISENAGLDVTSVMNQLTFQLHDVNNDNGDKWYGVDVSFSAMDANRLICDTLESGVWEPVSSKIHALECAIEAACVILSVDETVRNPQTAQPGAPDESGVGLAPVSEGMGGKGMAGLMGRGKKGMVKAMKGRGGG